MSVADSRPAVVVEPDRAPTGVVVAGYLMAVLIPLIGLIVGIVLMLKRRMGHGIGVMALSVVTFVVHVSLIVGAAANDTAQQLNQTSQQFDSYATCLDNAQTADEINACDGN